MEMTAAKVARTEEDVATLEDQMAEIQTELDIAQLKAAIAANQHSQCKECGTGQCQHKRQRSMCMDGHCQHKRNHRCKDCKRKRDYDQSKLPGASSTRMAEQQLQGMQRKA